MSKMRASVAAALAAGTLVFTAACSSGESAADTFKKDLMAMGYEVVSVSSEHETLSLGMEPAAFGASSRPRSSTGTSGRQSKPSPTAGVGKSRRSPSATPTSHASTAHAANTATVLEAIVKVDGHQVELERVVGDTRTLTKKYKGRTIHTFTVDEIKVGSSWREVRDNERLAGPTPSELKRGVTSRY